MKKIFIFYIIIFSNLVFAETKKLTLEETISLGISNSEDIKIINTKMYKTDNQYREALSYALPNFSASVDWTNYLKAPVMRADLGPQMGGVLEMPIKQPYELVTSITMTQAIYTFGKVKGGLKIADNAKDIENKTLKTIKSELKYYAKVLYYKALWAKKNLEISKMSYENAIKNQNILKQKFSAGRASKYQNVKMEVDVSSRIPLVTTAQNEYDNSIRSLKSFTNLDTDIELVSESPKSFTEYKTEKITEDIVENTSRLQALKSATKLYKNLASVRKADYYPSIGLFANYQYYGNNNKVFIGKTDMSHMFALGINISGNIWDGGKTGSVYKQAINDFEISQFEYQKAKKQISLELETSIDTYNSMLKTYEANLRTLELAKQSYELSKSSFLAGQITQSDLNDAELMYTRSKLSVEANILQTNIAQAQIEKLIEEEKYE